MSETVVFSRELYGLQAVRDAAEAYADLAGFEISESDGDIVVKIADIDAEVERVLVDEFCNYALHEAIGRRGQEAGS